MQKPELYESSVAAATTATESLPVDAYIESAYMTAGTPADLTFEIEFQTNGVWHSLATGADALLQTVLFDAAGQGVFLKAGTSIRFSSDVSGTYKTCIQYRPTGA